MVSILESSNDFTFPFFRKRGEEIYSFVNNNFEGILEVLQGLADKESKETLLEIIRVACTNDIYRRDQACMEKKYWECYKPVDKECFVNCGSAYGDTVLHFIDDRKEKDIEFDYIYCIEGNKKIYNDLCKNMSHLPTIYKDKMSIRNEYIGIDNDIKCFDRLFANVPVSLVNMDIEGAEMGVLAGMKEVIKKTRPVLAVCAYHKASDLVDIPTFIHETVSDYRVYLRKYNGAGPSSLNEYLYYLVPEERSYNI